MGRHSPSKQRHRAKFRLQWAPVLRTLRVFAQKAGETPGESTTAKLKNPEVKQAAKDFMAATRQWNVQWEQHRKDKGIGFRTPDGPVEAPHNYFQRLQRACKAYGYSMRPGASLKESAKAATELLDCGANAPLNEIPFTEEYSSVETCRKALGRTNGEPERRTRRVGSNPGETGAQGSGNKLQPNPR